MMMKHGCSFVWKLALQYIFVKSHNIVLINVMLCSFYKTNVKIKVCSALKKVTAIYNFCFLIQQRQYCQNIYLLLKFEANVLKTCNGLSEKKKYINFLHLFYATLMHQIFFNVFYYNLNFLDFRIPTTVIKYELLFTQKCDFQYRYKKITLRNFL